MSTFKLGLSAADGRKVEVPAWVNRFASVAAVKQFAADNGFDASQWPDQIGKSLKTLFSNAAFLPVAIQDPVKDQDWSALRDALHGKVGVREPSLFPYPWPVIEQRIQSGVLDDLRDGNGNLVATFGFSPKLVGEIRKRLHLPGDGYGPNDHQVFVTGTGFCAASHRGTGLYTNFRRASLIRKGAGNRLLMSEALGTGASYVNITEGWTLINPYDFPFASALSGVLKSKGTVGQKYELASGLELDLPKYGLYSGKTISFDLEQSGSRKGKRSKEAEAFLEAHSFDDYLHIFVNDYDKLVRFEWNICKSLGLIDTRGLNQSALTNAERLDLISGIDEKVKAHEYKKWVEVVELEHAFSPEVRKQRMARAGHTWDVQERPASDQPA